MKRKSEREPDAFDRLSPFNDRHEKTLKTICGQVLEANSIDIQNKAGLLGGISRIVPIEDKKILHILNKMKQTGSKDLTNNETANEIDYLDHLIHTCENNPTVLPDFSPELINYLRRISHYYHETAKPMSIPSNP